MAGRKRAVEAVALLVGIGAMVYFRANRSDGAPEPWWAYALALLLAAGLIWYDRAGSRRRD